MYGFDTSKPLYTLTVGEFFHHLEEFIQKVADGGKDITAEADKPTGRLVYGLAGIEELFHVSHKTAQYYYKDHIICEAVRQNGRKIVTDVDLALKLFNQRRTDK